MNEQAPDYTELYSNAVESGRYAHSYLQVRTVDVSPTVARANELDEPRGLLVIDVGDGPCNGMLRG